MDLSAIKATEKTVDIKHPATGLPTGLQLTIVPMTDQRVQAVQRKTTNARLAKRNAKLTSEQLEAEARELMDAAVVGVTWGGTASLHGEKPKHSPETVKALLDIDWIRKQVDEELSDQESFYQA